MWTNSSGSMVPSYFSGRSSQNLVGQLTRLKFVVKARQPAPYGLVSSSEVVPFFLLGGCLRGKKASLRVLRARPGPTRSWWVPTPYAWTFEVRPTAVL